ncbi:MAG: hypothetical protein ACYCSA_10460 [Thermoplasmataceae archaeon]
MEKNMREKQKSEERDLRTHPYDPQNRKSMTPSLNRRETLSEQSLKTPLTTTMWEINH